MNRIRYVASFDRNDATLIAQARKAGEPAQVVFALAFAGAAFAERIIDRGGIPIEGSRQKPHLRLARPVSAFDRAVISSTCKWWSSWRNTEVFVGYFDNHEACGSPDVIFMNLKPYHSPLGILLTDPLVLPVARLKKMQSDDGHWNFVEGKAWIGKPYRYSEKSRSVHTFDNAASGKRFECEVVLVWDERGLFGVMPTECLDFEASGVMCLACGEEVKEGEQDPAIQGPIHRECGLRAVIGSLGHVRRRCSCYGGTEEDPIGMTRREAAKVAVAEWRRRGSTIAKGFL